MTSLPVSFRTYGFDYSLVTPSVIFHPGVSTDDVSTLLTGGKTVGSRVLNSGAKVLFLGGCHRIKRIQQLQVEDDIGWVQQHNSVHLIDHEYKVAVSGAAEIELRKHANKVTGIMHRDFTFEDLMRPILNFSMSFEKAYNEKFVVARIVDTLKDMIDSDFPTEISDQFYYRYFQVAKVMYRHESVCAPVEKLKADVTWSRSLGISHLNHTRLYTASKVELPVLVRAESNF